MTPRDDDDLARQRLGYVSLGGINPRTKRPRCRYCGDDIPSSSRRTAFCSAECVHEWKCRTDTEYIRLCIERRDRGRCAHCKLDTLALKIVFDRWIYSVAASTKPQPKPTKSAETPAEGYNRVANHKSYELAIAGWLAVHGIPRHRAWARWWDADHILPVAAGGGVCGLDNYQTLCIPCHKAKTARQSTRAAALRKAHKTPISSNE
jgi:5-methylcytosine-specific restriction enzyme A